MSKSLCVPGSRSTFQVNTTGWLQGLRVTADGTGIVSHAGVALIRALADNMGLTGGLSRALASDRLLVHDRGRVMADLACAIADGAEVISDFRVIGDQQELFGLVASVPTVWRTLSELAAGGQRALEGMTAAVNAARPRAWRGIQARHGAIPVRIADKVLEMLGLTDFSRGHRDAPGSRRCPTCSIQNGVPSAGRSVSSLAGAGVDLAGANRVDGPRDATARRFCRVSHDRCLDRGCVCRAAETPEPATPAEPAGAPIYGRGRLSGR